MNTRRIATLARSALIASALALAAPALAGSFALADGKVKFYAPDAWPTLMEKLNGQHQFVALQVRNPDDTTSLARITVTTEQVDGLGGFRNFLNAATARARKLPGYVAVNSNGDTSSMHYSASENRETNAYVEAYTYRDNLAIQVRCIRPAAAHSDWRATFDSGCQSIITAVEK